MRWLVLLVLFLPIAAIAANSADAARQARSDLQRALDRDRNLSPPHPAVVRFITDMQARVDRHYHPPKSVAVSRCLAKVTLGRDGHVLSLDLSTCASPAVATAGLRAIAESAPFGQLPYNAKSEQVEFYFGMR